MNPSNLFRKAFKQTSDFVERRLRSQVGLPLLMLPHVPVIILCLLAVNIFSNKQMTLRKQSCNSVYCFLLFVQKCTLDKKKKTVNIYSDCMSESLIKFA